MDFFIIALIVVAVLALGGLVLVVTVAIVFPILFAEAGFDIDYGAWGILLPVIVYFVPKHTWRVGSAAILLLIRCIHYAFLGVPMQWWSLVCVPLLALYNEKRGRAKMKYVFYIFYPVHLVIIYGIAILIEMLK